MTRVILSLITFAGILFTEAVAANGVCTEEEGCILSCNVKPPQETAIFELVKIQRYAVEHIGDGIRVSTIDTKGIPESWMLSPDHVCAFSDARNTKIPASDVTIHEKADGISKAGNEYNVYSKSVGIVRESEDGPKGVFCLQRPLAKPSDCA